MIRFRFATSAGQYVAPRVGVVVAHPICSSYSAEYSS